MTFLRALSATNMMLAVGFDVSSLLRFLIYNDQAINAYFSGDMSFKFLFQINTEIKSGK